MIMNNLLLRDDGVTQGQNEQCLEDDLMLGVVGVVHSLNQLFVTKVHVRHFRVIADIIHVIHLSLLDLTVRYATNADLLELHDVAREGAGLVREDVLNLPQLLIQTG